MIYSAVDLGITIDTGYNRPGSILQRKEIDGWKNYLIGGKLVTGPIDVKELQPGKVSADKSRWLHLTPASLYVIGIVDGRFKLGVEN